MLEQPHFGRRLRDLRLEKGLTQAALASDGLSTGYLSRLESGDRPPTPRVLNYLVDRLGVSSSAFEKASESRLAEQLATVVSANGVVDDVEALAGALRADTGNLTLRWQALWLLAAAMNQRGEHEEQRELLAELVELSDELAVLELRVRSRVELAGLFRVLGRNDDARTTALAAVELCQDGGLPVADKAAALMTLVAAETEAGLISEARARADELSALTRDAPPEVRAKALWTAASVYKRQGDDGGAMKLMTEALERIDSNQDVILWLRLRLAAASMELQGPDPETELAARWLDEAAAAVALVGSVQHDQELRALRAHLAFAAGSFDEAAELAGSVGDGSHLAFRDRVRLDMLRGRIAIRRGDVEAGSRELQELARQAQESLNIDLAAEIWRALAEALTSDR
ncbi:helix-turn-helix domain-containing protein [Amycolatopsis roodepoortensis]|uniref:helix-turn-helix transcriptional regulator n=1 Tax=Amycolatopsis roodepoortensis TaxID=700274 RepID=UPI00298EEFE6|nr:helix-turn-helix transcriptional regulator [Amycolatopsis roodepoortensis]